MTRSVEHVAASDCERCRPGLIAQPVNTVSSLAFVVSGAALLRSGRRRDSSTPAETAVGWWAVGAGLGSVAYHGPGTGFGRYLHDASLLGLLGSMAVADAGVVFGRRPPAAVVAAASAVAVVAARPATSMAAQLGFGLTATAAEAARFAAAPASGAERWRRRLEGAVAGAGAVAHLLGRTGGPWCDPSSVVQPHALWHGAMATAVWLRGRDLPTPPTPRSGVS